MTMDKKQFDIVADKVCRKDAQRKAAFDVIFRGVSVSEAERKHNCVKNTVSNTVNIIRNHFDHCVAVVNAK